MTSPSGGSSARTGRSAAAPRAPDARARRHPPPDRPPRDLRPGTSACALASGMPGRSPSACAAPIGGRDDAPPPVAAGQHQRRLRRRRCAHLPTQPVGRPGRQEERDDPWHRRPPPRIRALPARHADQLDQPARPADARHRQRRRRQRRDPPAGHRGGGLAEVRGLLPRRQRRSAMPIVPEASAASCSRREAVIGRRATSATTPRSPPCRSPSSEQAAPSSRRRPRHRSPGRDAARPGQGRREQIARATHHSTAPLVRARMPAANSAAAAPSTAPARRRRPRAGRRAPARLPAGGHRWPPRRTAQHEVAADRPARYGQSGRATRREYVQRRAAYLPGRRTAGCVPILFFSAAHVNPDASVRRASHIPRRELKDTYWLPVRQPARAELTGRSSVSEFPDTRNRRGWPDYEPAWFSLAGVPAPSTKRMSVGAVAMRQLVRRITNPHGK